MIRQQNNFLSEFRICPTFKDLIKYQLWKPQDKPRHENAFKSDPFLQRWLKTTIPNDFYQQIEPDLINFGEQVSKDIWKLGEKCEKEPPSIKAGNAWGLQASKLETSQVKCPEKYRVSHFLL